MKYLYRHSIWHPGAIEPEEFKYRHLKRIWLPLFDVVCVLIGLLAVRYGSAILNQAFDSATINAVGTVFVVVSILALVGVSFPALWMLEMASKVVMMAFLGTYSITIWVSFFHGEVLSGFVGGVLLLPVVLPLFRLQLLGEELKQRGTDISE